MILERFVEEYSEPAYQFAYGLCADEEEAKDLVQEAFYKVLHHWDRYDQGQPLKSWFYTILRNVYNDRCRRFERRHGVSLSTPLAHDEDGGVLAEALPDTSLAPILDQLGRDEDTRRVHRALASLRSEYRAVLTLCDMKGMGYEEIAQALNWPSGTVRSRLSRARTLFKEKMLELLGKEEEVNAYAV